MLQQNVIDTLKFEYNEHVHNEFTLIAKTNVIYPAKVLPNLYIIECL